MILTAHVIPNAKKTEIVSWLDNNTVKVRVAAPPEKGRANCVLIEFLADHFKIKKNAVELTRGATTRIKQFKITS